MTLSRRRVVLSIEDDEAVRQSLEAALEFSDIQVVSYPEGGAALAWLRTLEDGYLPSLILLDLQIYGGGMDGWRFRQEQLADDRLAHIPTVILSAVSRGEVDRAMMGCAGFLPKPFDLEALLAAIHKSETTIRDAVKTMAAVPAAKRRTGKP